MARRTHVPKFGNWDANDHMPYTVVFDHARQGRGKPINPNDPSENPNMFPAGRGNGAPGRRPFNPNDPEDSMEAPDLPQEKPQTLGSREGSGSGSGRTQQQHQVAAAAAPRKPAPLATQGNGLPTRVPPGDPKRGSRDNGLDRSAESASTSFSADQSPSHPSGLAGSQGRGARLGANSPAWDRGRKSTGEDGQAFAPATPNRSRLRNNANNNSNKEEVPSKSSSAGVPKFGEWNDQDVGSGDGFTVMFNNAIHEKKTGGVVNPRTPEHKHAADLYEPPVYQKGHGPKKSWFCWCAPDANE